MPLPSTVGDALTVVGMLVVGYVAVWIILEH